VRTSAALGRDGLGILSYRAAGHLRVAHCQNVNCTSLQTHDIDTSGDTGWYSAIKIGGDGLPLISYVVASGPDHQPTRDLKVAHCADVACTSATVTTLDAPATVDDNTSLSIGADGLGLIAYQDNASSKPVRIKVAHCLNAACTTANTRTLDMVGSNNGGSGDGEGTVSIAAAPNGLAYLAYYDGSPRENLKITACADPDCAGTTPQLTIDTPASTGRSPSITIGRDALPLISYNGNSTTTSSDLVVAHCANAYCTAITRASVHTDGVFTGSYGSITIGADGLGVVAYTDQTNHDVEVAHCADLRCSSVTHVNLDEFDDQGRGADAITIGADGLPLIAYRDTTDNLLKVAHCGDAACATPLVAPF